MIGAIDSPAASFSRISSTVILVPVITGLPIITFGSDVITAAMIPFIPPADFRRDNQVACVQVLWPRRHTIVLASGRPAVVFADFNAPFELSAVRKKPLLE